MSNLVVSNISDGTTSVGTGYVVNGSAKAWVNFDGQGTAAINDSMNISALIDYGTGVFGVNFTNSMSSGVYAMSGLCGDVAYQGHLHSYDTGSFRTASSAGMYTLYAADLGGGGAGLDYSTNDVVIHGDLA